MEKTADEEKRRVFDALNSPERPIYQIAHATEAGCLPEGERPISGCYDCGRPYGHEHGFPDLVIPFAVWERISPTGDDGGLLCPSCICKRLHDAGIRCEGAFMSGPIVSVSQPTMDAIRRIENIELAIEGRDNKWGVLLRAPTPPGAVGTPAARSGT